MEIALLKERGLVNSYEDYLRLPQAVIEDVRMLTLREAESKKKPEGRSRRAKQR